MAEIIARFADGRLLVQEEKTLASHYTSGGMAIRIGHLKTVEKVLSIEAYMSGQPQYSVAAPLKEAKTSGDTVVFTLRRSDMVSGMGSGALMASFLLSGVTSGIDWNREIASGLVSGRLNILTNVIGF